MKHDRTAPGDAEDATLLFPDVDVTVRDPDTGEAVLVTVRELRFLEGLRLAAAVRPLIEAIAALVGESGDQERGDLDAGMLAAAIADHADIWIDAIARATGRDAAWIGRLSDHDGQALSAAMWSANTDFFVRRVIEDVMRRRQASPSPSPTSSMPSCGPDTDADTATSPSG